MLLSGGLSPAMRQSFVGLMILAALGSAAGLALWIRNISFGEQSFQAVLRFSSVGQLTTGTAVLLRGVEVGQVADVETSASGVDVTVEISPADRLIPRRSSIQINQALFVGEPSIDITPVTQLPPGDLALPLDEDCNPEVIICDGSELSGQAPVNLTAVLQSLLEISQTLSDPTILAALESLSDISDTFANPEIATALKAVSEEAPDALRQVSTLGRELTAIAEAFRASGGIDTLDQTLNTVDSAAEQVSAVLANSEGELIATLGSIQQTSDRLQRTIMGIDPILAEVQDSNLLNNLERLSADAAAVADSIETVTASVDDPAVLVQLRQTLDSAQSVFDNLRKISADLDELTGDPEFRNNLEELVDGLSGLVSSTEVLRQQTQVVEIAHRLEAEALNGRRGPAYPSREIPSPSP